MVTVAPADQRRLLEVQELDTRLDQLAHTRATLPEAARAAELETLARTLRDDVVLLRTKVSDLDRELQRAENDVQAVRTRAERDRARLDSGQGSAKDLVGLQHEVESLARRQSDLEDVELEVMERREEQAGLLEQTEARLADVEAERETRRRRPRRPLRRAGLRPHRARGRPQGRRDRPARGHDQGLRAAARPARQRRRPARRGPLRRLPDADGALGGPRAAAAPGRRDAPLPRVRAHPRPAREHGGVSRAATGSGSGSRRVGVRRASARRRGRRRLARQPGAVRLRGARARPGRHRARRGGRALRPDHEQRRRVLRPARRAADGRRHRPDRPGRGADGLQARRRADVRALEDQGPAPGRHRRAGLPRLRPVARPLHVGAAGAERRRRPAGQRRDGRHRADGRGDGRHARERPRPDVDRRRHRPRGRRRPRARPGALARGGGRSRGRPRGRPPGRRRRASPGRRGARRGRASPTSARRRRCCSSATAGPG